MPLVSVFQDLIEKQQFLGYLFIWIYYFKNMDKYKITKTLGDGTYGSVVKAINI